MTEGEDKGADAGERFGESCGVRGAAKRPLQRVGGSPAADAALNYRGLRPDRHQTTYGPVVIVVKGSS